MCKSSTFEMIIDLVDRKEMKVSAHGYDELAEDGILIKDILSSIANAEIVEDYPDYPKGPCVLVLQKDLEGRPMHVVWGIPKGATSPAVVVTAYRPEPDQWSSDFKRRQ